MPPWGPHSWEASGRHVHCTLVRRKNFLERRRVRGGRRMSERGRLEMGKGEEEEEEEQRGRLVHILDMFASEWQL